MVWICETDWNASGYNVRERKDNQLVHMLVTITQFPTTLNVKYLHLDTQITKTTFNIQTVMFLEVCRSDPPVAPACQLHQHNAVHNGVLCCYVTATKQVMTMPVVTPMNFTCLLSPNFAQSADTLNKTCLLLLYHHIQLSQGPSVCVCVRARAHTHIS
jgi:hypothetical protein